MTAYGTEFFSIVHRPLETDDDLTAFFTWREPRRVSKSLTVQYDKVLYLIEDNELSRRAIGKYIEVWHYPDGRKELRLNGVVLPYSHATFSDPELLTPCPGPALPGLPDHSFPVTDVKRETVPARMRPIEKSSLHQVRSRCWRQ